MEENNTIANENCPTENDIQVTSNADYQCKPEYSTRSEYKKIATTKLVAAVFLVILFRGRPAMKSNGEHILSFL